MTTHPMSTSLTGTFQAIAVEDGGSDGTETSNQATDSNDENLTEMLPRGDKDHSESDSESEISCGQPQKHELSPAGSNSIVTEVSTEDGESERSSADATTKPLKAKDSNVSQSVFKAHNDTLENMDVTSANFPKAQVKRPFSLKRKSDVLEDKKSDLREGSPHVSGLNGVRKTEGCDNPAGAAVPRSVKEDTPSKQTACTPPAMAQHKDSPNTFVKDWEFVQTLGEGAYGEVKLAYNIRTKEAVAVKIIDTSAKTSNPSIMDDIRKEVCIHRMISHPNIIKFYGVRKDGPIQYLFLEYASGGELFDRIEPDVGMPQVEAQNYFRQLIDGLEYLHSKGIAHRDIKPENLLLDENDTLKIADFGLATIFRHQGKWRYLERVCGSAPYLAPEVISRPYKAEPADIWSCGIVLVAMLGGELPWDAPVLSCIQYCEWRECHIENKPWSKIDNLALCLIRRVLADKADKRYTIEEIRKNQWFKKDFSRDAGEQFSAGPKRFRSGSSSGDSPGLISLSQPEISRSLLESSIAQAGGRVADRKLSMTTDDCPISFSQPAQADDMLLSSQLNGTQSSQTPLQKLVRRMTRFFSKHPRTEVMEELDKVFSVLGYNWKYNSSNMLTVHTLDRRQSTLTFKVMILEMGESQLVDFRLSKGDGLEFKRHFLRMREMMKTIICKVPPTWPNLPNF